MSEYKYHNFKEDLDESTLDTNDPLWIVVYKQKFGDNIKISKPVDDIEFQKKGVDKVIKHGNDTFSVIDEKVRYHDYGDFLVEVTSCIHSNTPGWINKDLLTDYIAYHVKPSKKVIFVPFKPLQQMWKEYGDTFTSTYGTREARNPTYTTLNVPIPLDRLSKFVSIETILYGVVKSPEIWNKMSR